jgi:hypothetical protein
MASGSELDVATLLEADLLAVDAVRPHAETAMAITAMIQRMRAMAT